MGTLFEKDFCQVSNGALEKLCKFRISGEASQVLHAIIRKTWGWGKGEDKIAISTIQKMTTLNKGNVCRALRKLKRMKVIKAIGKNDDRTPVTYCVNQNYDEWRVVSKKTISSKKTTEKSKNDDSNLSSIMTTSKDISIKNTLKDSIPPSATFSLKTKKEKKKTDPRIKAFIDYWFQDYGKVFPGEKYVVQGGKDTAAVKRLLYSASLEDMKTAASWFLRLESDDWLGGLGKEVALFVMKYNEIRQRMKSPKILEPGDVGYMPR